MLEGRVGNIVAFGVFVDLPEFGARASGLLPRELTGQPREAELKDHFKVGQPVRVEVIEMREGKIRLGLEGGPRPEPRAPRPERAERSERPAGGGHGAGGGRGGDRGGRGGDRGGRGGDRGGRGEGRGSRGPRDERPSIISSSTAPEGPTMMALALRKAMEEAKRKAEGKGK